jgi:prolipoprotein diacylglyceryltransferase
LVWGNVCHSFFVRLSSYFIFFKKEGRPLEQADELLLYAMIATVLGARMGHYFFYEYPTLLSNPGHFFWSMIRPPYAGLASHGAAI